VPNMNSSSRSKRLMLLLRSFWKSMLIGIGRLLIACGGSMSGLGARLIINAERDRLTIREALIIVAAALALSTFATCFGIGVYFIVGLAL